MELFEGLAAFWILIGSLVVMTGILTGVVLASNKKLRKDIESDLAHKRDIAKLEKQNEAIAQKELCSAHAVQIETNREISI